MNTTNIETENLKLVLETPEETRAFIDGMSPTEKAALSADWLAQVAAAKSPDPWVHGFTLKQRTSGIEIGDVGFKGPPSEDGVVEIAYVIHPDHQGKGYATEAAGALVTFAFSNSGVHVVRAHTLPEPNASTRVLTKCGFQKIGEVIDPDDGPVWRWEKRREAG